MYSMHDARTDVAAQMLRAAGSRGSAACINRSTQCPVGVALPTSQGKGGHARAPHN